MHKYIYILMMAVFISCGNDEGQNPDAGPGTANADSLALNNKIMGVAKIEPEDGIIEVMAGSSGIVDKILVDEGDQIEIGQVLVQLENEVESAQLQQVKSRKNSQAASIDYEKEQVAAAKNKLSIARKNLEFYQSLYDSKGATLQELDDKKNEKTIAENDLKLAEANLKAAEKKLNDNNAEINYYAVLLAQKSIHSGNKGLVLQRLVDLGNYVTPQTTLFEVASGPTMAKTEVDELFADKIKIGLDAEILSQSTGEILSKGKVIEMSNYLRSKSIFNDKATEPEDRRVREVIIGLDNPDQLIGSRVDCIIYLKDN